MKILHLTYSNAAGVPAAYSRALVEFGEQSRCQAEIPSDIGYTVDDVDRDLTKHLNWADAIVAYDSPHIVEVAHAAGKPWMYVALGTHAYENWSKIARWTAGVNKVADQLEFVRLGCEYMPKPIWPGELDRFKTDTHAEFTVCHAPSNPGMKGARAIVAACEQAGLNYDLITGVSHTVCLARKARCHALVDMVDDGSWKDRDRLDGFAVNGIEAFELGIPVLGECSNENYTAHREAFGIEFPYIEVSVDTLADALCRLRDDVSRANHYAALGRAYLRQFADPVTCASRIMEMIR